MKFLWFILASKLFCLSIGLKLLYVVMDGSFENCQHISDNELYLDFTGLECIPVDDDQFELNGTIEIRAHIEHVSVEIETEKFERGTWINSYLNTFITDICELLENPGAPEWVDVIRHMTSTEKCPFEPRRVIYNDFKSLVDITVDGYVPSSLLGQWRGKATYYTKYDNELKIIGCAVAYFEIRY